MTNSTVVSFAELMRVSESTIRNWEKGRGKGVTEKEVVQVIATLSELGVNCSSQWLLYGVGKGPTLIDETLQGHISTPDDDSLIYSEIELFTTHHPNSTYTRISDNSMEPYFFSGDFVAGIIIPENKYDLFINKPCIINFQEAILVGFLSKNSDRKHPYSIKTNNTQDISLQESSQIVAVAPICFIRRKLTDILLTN